MPVEGVRRPAWAEISRSAIAHNVAVLREVLGPSALCAVVKANGYGHGAPLAAHAVLEGGADSLAVALVDEGIELRGAGVTAPILLLAEIPADTLADAMSHSLSVTIGSLAGARAAVDTAERLGGRHRVHLKVDTGMHRMGVAPEEAVEAVGLLRACAHLDLEGIYTHFSVADGDSEESRDYTRSQLATLQGVVGSLAAVGGAPRLVHAANSAGALAFPESRLSMARVGLALYGHLPSPWVGEDLRARGLALRPALTLRARVVAVRRVGAGERPSYGRLRATSSETTVVTVPFGYADGYPWRLFAAGAEVLIGGRRYPLAGAVTMDQLVIDVGDDPIGLGEEVVLLGPQGAESIEVAEWARHAATISWEILCGIGARVPRVVVE